ncbi:Uncharacterised protein [Nocardia otitidiscaviarum]|uniref:Uncharacterized protein n=1 Tax=Nocardia otitidiscaviarum TaxID=1823 RepID=A0A379JLM4_9NOCA|nr:hypothetical protein [Nocardia otitidiscaviarum]SUD49559.1 Uncharacterised protein [Nocardia otitidiscaviarum]
MTPEPIDSRAAELAPHETARRIAEAAEHLMNDEGDVFAAEALIMSIPPGSAADIAPIGESGAGEPGDAATDQPRG